MQEKLRITVEADGTRTVSRALQQIGIEGYKAAVKVESNFAAAMKNMRWQTQVAMKSHAMAEQQRVRDARIAAQEVSRLRRSEAQAAAQAARAAAASARESARAQVAAARQAAREQAQLDRMATRQAIEQAKARRRAEFAHRQRIRDAKTDATMGMGPHIGAAVGIYGAINAVRTLGQYSDAAINVSNRLRIVTSSQEELNGLLDKLRNKALDARSEFDLTARTYARLTLSTKQLNLEQSANLAMTETLTKAIAVSGATGAEAHATLIQLSQAMASNRLSADEFRSVSEQLPIVLDLLANSTGKARTELKSMGEDGQLTAQVMAIALLEGLDDIREQFAKTEPTIEQAWENIRTQTHFAVKEFNEATGAARKITEALQWMAENMDTVTAAAKALGAAIGTYLIAQLGLAAAAMVTLASTNPFIAAATGLAALIGLMIAYRDEIKETTTELGYFAAAQNIPASMMTEEMKQAIRNGQTPSQMRAGSVPLKPEDLTFDMMEAVREKNQRENDIAAIKLQGPLPTDKKKKKGRKIPTFEDAVRDLEDQVAMGSLTEMQRENASEAIRVQMQIQRNLTSAEAEYVATLIKSRQMQEALADAQEEARAAAAKRYEESTKNIVALKQEQEEARDAAQDLYRAQLAVENQIHRKQYDGFNSQEDIRNARRTVKDMVLGGRLDQSAGEYALDNLEIQDPNASDARKDYLKEMLGLGQLHEDITGIFGPNGTLNVGLADATANAIVFGKSFKTAVNDLGKLIQAQIISSLIQAGIRMTLLGLAGGATATPGATPIGFPNSAGGYITGRGKGYAMGGYTGDDGRTKIAGYVHGGEYVLNAGATQRIGRPTLDAMNKSGAVPQQAQAPMVINFIDQAGVRMEAKQGMTPNEVTLIARREAQKEAGKAVAGSIRNPNSDVSKSLRGNTNMRFQR